MALRGSTDPLKLGCGLHSGGGVYREENVLVRAKADTEAASTVPIIVAGVVIHPVGDGEGGIGLPIMNGWNGKSIVNISGQAVHVRPNVPGMITENYLRLSVGLSFNEGWFDKWKVQ